MFEAALKYLTDLAQKAAAPVTVLETPREKYLSTGGSIEQLEIPAAPRKHRIGSLADLAVLANRFHEHEENPPVVWYDEDRVVLVIDDLGHRVETATLPLVKSEVFRRIEALAKTKPWFEQRDFVRLLRVELAGTLPPGVLLDKVRKVSFAQGSTTSGEVRRNQESLGREITSRVHSDGEIPEEVTLALPVYSTAGERDRYSLRCAVEVDTARCAFQLVPLPDEIDYVLQQAMLSVHGRLAKALDEHVPAYYGAPTYQPAS